MEKFTRGGVLVKKGAKGGFVTKTSWRTDFRRNYSLYLMALPGIVFFFILSYIPIGFLVVAFQNYKAARGILGSTFVGLKNFRDLFGDFMFPTILKNTIILNLLKIFLTFPMPVVLALCFNEMPGRKIKGTLQSVVYLPHFFSWVIIYGIMNAMLNTNSGLLNQVIISPGCAFFSVFQAIASAVQPNPHRQSKLKPGRLKSMADRVVAYEISFRQKRTSAVRA